MENTTIRDRWNGLNFEDGLTTVLVLNIVFLVSFWTFSLSFLYVDLYNRPRWMMKYKTQPGKNEPVNMKDLKRVMHQNTVNYLSVGLPYSVLHYVLHVLRGSEMTYTLPSLQELLSCAVVFILVEEVTSYYTHRIFHSSYLYKTVHKQHHEWHAPIALGAVYAHPVEFAFNNIWTLATGPLVMGSCQVTTLTWFFLATMGIIILHCGYHLPLLPSPEFHDYHHLKGAGNYGVLGILDRVHGTVNAHWLESKQGKRHGLIFSAAEMK